MIPMAELIKIILNSLLIIICHAIIVATLTLKYFMNNMEAVISHCLPMFHIISECLSCVTCQTLDRHTLSLSKNFMILFYYK